MPDFKSKQQLHETHATDAFLVLQTLLTEEVIKKGTFDYLLGSIRNMKANVLTPQDVIHELYTKGIEYREQNHMSTSAASVFGRSLQIGEYTLKIVKTIR